MRNEKGGEKINKNNKIIDVQAFTMTERTRFFTMKKTRHMKRVIYSEFRMKIFVSNSYCRNESCFFAPSSSHFYFNSKIQFLASLASIFAKLSSSNLKLRRERTFD